MNSIICRSLKESFIYLIKCSTIFGHHFIDDVIISYRGQSKEFFKIQHILLIVKVFCTKFECNMTIKSQNTWCPVIRVKVNYNSDVIGFILICSAKILYLAAFIYHEGTM